MGSHRGSAEIRWASLSKEERSALPPDERATILAEIQTHQAKRAALNLAKKARKDRELEEATRGAAQLLARLRAHHAELWRIFAGIDEEAKT